MTVWLSESTSQEAERMRAAGMEQITPAELDARLETLGYAISKPDCFQYVNGSNAITYRAKSVHIIDKQSRKSFANIESKRGPELKALQAIRLNCFVFNNNTIWEL